MPRIIDSVLVNDNGPDQSTELDQRMPVAAIAGEPGGFDREYGSHAPLADRCQQTLEARPSDAAARPAEIIIDDLDEGPAELFGAIGEPILASPAASGFEGVLLSALQRTPSLAPCSLAAASRQ